MLIEREVPLSDGMTGAIYYPKWDEGDHRVEWNKNDPKSLEAARKTFIDLKAEKYKAYRLDPKTNDKGVLMTEFDPNAEKVVFIPQFAGG